MGHSLACWLGRIVAVASGAIFITARIRTQINLDEILAASGTVDSIQFPTIRWLAVCLLPLLCR